MITHDEIHKFFYSYTDVKGYKQIKGRKSPDTILEKWSCIFPKELRFTAPDACIMIDYDRSKKHHENCRCLIYSRMKCNCYRVIAEKNFSQTNNTINDIKKFFDKNIKKLVKRVLENSQEDIERYENGTCSMGVEDERITVKWCEDYLSNN